MSEAKPPVVVVAERVDRLEGEKVTYRAATVVATNPGQRTIDVDVANAGKLEGLAIPEGSFFPRIGDEGELRQQGSRVSWVANRIALGAVGDDELAGYVKDNITVAMGAANGKNTLFYSPDGPTGATPGKAAGDSWMQRDNLTRVITGTWEWDGAAWKPVTYGDQVLASLTVGKLVGGAATFDLIVGGRITTAGTGQRTELNPLGLQSFNGAGSLTVNIDGVDNLLTGRVRTGLTGRRVEVGVTGAAGEVRFFAANGTTQSFLRSYTDTTSGQEGLQLGMPIAGAPATWNALYYNAQEWTSYQTKIHDFVYQDRWSVIQTTSRGAGGSKRRLYLDPDAFQIRGGYNADESKNIVYDFFTGTLTGNLSSGGSYKFGDGLSNQSPALTLVQPDGIGIILRTQSANSLSAFFDVKNGFDNNWATIRAAAFTPTSDRATKEDITDAAIVDPLAQVRTIRPRNFRRKHSGDRPVRDSKGAPAVVEAPGPIETGVIAQELPALLTKHNTGDEVMSFDMTAWLLLLTAAIQELDKKGKP